MITDETKKMQTPKLQIILEECLQTTDGTDSLENAILRAGELGYKIKSLPPTPITYYNEGGANSTAAILLAHQDDKQNRAVMVPTDKSYSLFRYRKAEHPEFETLVSSYLRKDNKGKIFPVANLEDTKGGSISVELRPPEGAGGLYISTRISVQEQGFPGTSAALAYMKDHLEANGFKVHVIGK